MADDAKALSINMKDLAEVVDRAVADVLGEHDVLVAKGLTFGPGTLIGRVLPGGLTDVAGVQKVAAAVTSSVQRSLGSKGSLSPAALIGAGGRIIIGFVAEEAVETV